MSAPSQPTPEPPPPVPVLPRGEPMPHPMPVPAGLAPRLDPAQVEAARRRAAVLRGGPKPIP